MAHMKDEWLDQHYAHLRPQLPVYPPLGLTTDEFAESQRAFTEFARKRILLGAQEYDHGGTQRMEELSAVQIVQELREEIADAVNYLTGLDIYLSRIPWQLADNMGDTIR